MYVERFSFCDIVMRFIANPDVVLSSYNFLFYFFRCLGHANIYREAGTFRSNLMRQFRANVIMLTILYCLHYALGLRLILQ
jgi:hypothetical protein